ncbi:MAG: respiratory nitrate reductase subunit gamma [Desulfobacterales bacterium]|jgi:nitrate reductase gamma subunit|nr:respiratory nitrate reductase subunit gamma [Desulfobacterales bacterium]
MSTIDLVAFVAYPYLCLTIFTVGHAYRYVTDRYAWNAHSSELIEKKHLFIGSYLFHFGVLGTLAGHAVGLLVPQSIYDTVGIDSAAHTALAHIAGRVVGTAAFTGALLLLARRLCVKRVRLMSTASDFITLGGLIFVTGVGTYDVFLGGFNVLDSIAPWIRGILIFQPDPNLMAAVPLRYKLHILAAFTLLAYSPFCRLIHIWSVPVFYLFRRQLVFRRRVAT